MAKASHSWLQLIYKYMCRKILLLILLIAGSQCAYEPELMVTAQPQFLNRLIASYNETIIETINNYSIPNPPTVEEKVDGVKVTITLKDIKQAVQIHWASNILQVKDIHTFKLNSKNINLTLDAYLEAKIGFLKTQKGPLKITVSQLEADVEIMFDNPKCSKSMGFDVQIKDVYVNANALLIKIEGKTFDNLVISQVERYLKPRINSILAKAITEQVNPLISNYTCQRIEEEANINGKNYMITINTTEVPVFDAGLSYLKMPVDLTLQNLVTNQTNNELDRDDLPGNAGFAGFDLSVAASSNLLNTVMWLVGDAELLQINVNNSMMGDNPPISLNTTNLSILLPNLKTKEWANKEVILMISPSTKFEHLLVRSGRIVTVLSLSVKFVVVLKGPVTNVTQCLHSSNCITACDLNMTLPLSLSLRMSKTTMMGLLHSASFFDVETIASKIEVNTASFKSIINSIVGSMLPSVNSELVVGMDVPAALYNLTEKYHVSQLEMQAFQDYVGLGVSLQL